MWFGVSGSPQFVALAISEVGVLCFSCSAGEERPFLTECFTVVLNSFTSPRRNFTTSLFYLCFAASPSLLLELW